MMAWRTRPGGTAWMWRMMSWEKSGCRRLRCFARSVGSSLTWPVVGVVLALYLRWTQGRRAAAAGARVGLRAGIADENARTLLALLLAAGPSWRRRPPGRPGGAWSPRCAGRWRGWSRSDHFRGHQGRRPLAAGAAGQPPPGRARGRRPRRTRGKARARRCWHHHNRGPVPGAVARLAWALRPPPRAGVKAARGGVDDLMGTPEEEMVAWEEGALPAAARHHVA